MKKLFLIQMLFTLLFGVSSCTENVTPVYDAQRSSLNIWFGQDRTVLDSTTYNYSYVMSEGSVKFNARVAGLPTDFDRTFTLEVIEGSTAEAEGSYRTETYTIPAGETQVECQIFFNTSNLKNADSFSEKDGFLKFQMVKNDTFEEGAERYKQLYVVLKNYMAKPEEWDVAISPYLSWRRYFGDYSKVKYQFMIEKLGIMEFHISASATTPYNAETKEMSNNYANYLKTSLANALDEYEQEHGERLLDEFGNVVTF